MLIYVIYKKRKRETKDDPTIFCLKKLEGEFKFGSHYHVDVIYCY